MSDDDDVHVSVRAKGFCNKCVFATFPMWIAALVVIYSDVKPAPFIDTSPIDTSPEDGQQNDVDWLEKQLEAARADRKKNKAQVDELKAALSKDISPLTDMIDDVPAQGGLAFTFAFIAIMSVAGPGVFVNCYQAVIGSMFSALFVVGFIRVFVRNGDPYWMSAMGDVVDGSASLQQYLIFFVIWAFGIARWAKGWKLVTWEDDEETENVSSIKKPLLKAPALPGQRSHMTA